MKPTWEETYHCSTPGNHGLGLYLCDATENVVTPAVEIVAFSTVVIVKTGWDLLVRVSELAADAI